MNYLPKKLKKNKESNISQYFFDVNDLKTCMKDGLSLVINYAFNNLGLHRLEANIQPENTSSIGLARGLGFKKEGFSEKYLQVNGEWKDHERWSILVENWNFAESVT